MSSAAVTVSRKQALAFRRQAQQLAEGPRDLLDVAALDLGVQDTGPDGARWALACRGVELDATTDLSADLVMAWTLRGAPHVYRRKEAAKVAAATAPYSEEDAGKRVFDAAKQLRAAGVPVLEALAHEAETMRDIVHRPTVKGEVSTQLSERLDPAYLRYCTPCDATHSYEQTFRLSALAGGLELEPDTSPPVLRRIPRWRGPAARVPTALDAVRACLRLLGPTTPQHVTAFMDAASADVRSRWPEDAVAVEVDGARMFVLEEDLPALRSASAGTEVMLLAPFDLFLQVRDRETLVADGDRRKDLWRVLGRPGAVLRGSEVVGTWRPRARGATLRLAVDRWAAVPEKPLVRAAERLAAHRALEFDGWA